MSQSQQRTTSSQDPFNLKDAFKQFSLESERLEMTYKHLQERFKAVQVTLQESNTRLGGKLAELDFISRYLEAILHHMSQGILFIDINGIVTTYNTAAQKILQIPEKELLFHLSTDFFEDTFFGFSLDKAFATKQCLPNSFLIRPQLGEVTELEVEATFITMSQKAYPLAHRQASPDPILGLLILLRDRTKYRHLQQLANRHDRMKELGELASHLAHEIRNPLGGIKGFANLLQQELHERPDLQQMASNIAQGADELNQFVSKVLIYARPFQIHLENIELISFIEEIKQLMLADSAWNPHINFILRSSMAQLVIPIDPHLFKTALLNIFVNAAQAMPKGGDLVVTLEIDPIWAILYVTDTGMGIPKENMSKIFSPFFTTKEMGTGLGLAEVHKVIQAHEGEIKVQSQPNQGSTFIIKIPLKLKHSHHS